MHSLLNLLIPYPPELDCFVWEEEGGKEGGKEGGGRGEWVWVQGGKGRHFVVWV